MTCLQLSDDLGEIPSPSTRGACGGGLRERLVSVLLTWRTPVQHVDELTEVPHRCHGHPLDEPGLGRLSTRDDGAVKARLPSCQQRWQYTPHRPDPSIQSQLTQQHRRGEHGRGDDFVCCQGCCRDGKVEVGTCLGQTGWGEIDGQGLRGPRQAS